jgi:hypothetical protein
MGSQVSRPDRRAALNGLRKHPIAAQGCAMQSDHPKSGPQAAVAGPEKSSPMAALASDLSDLVDRLESDWEMRGAVSPEAAERLHQLLERARDICDGA